MTRLARRVLRRAQSRYVLITTPSSCDDGVVGDEFHYILKCKTLCIERKMYIQEIYINKPSIAVMHKLFNSCDVKILSNMVKFITIINAKFA